MDMDNPFRPLLPTLCMALLLGLALPLTAGANGFAAEFNLDSPENLPLRETLEKNASAGPFAAQLHRLYEKRAFQPLWNRDGAPTPQAMALAETLAHADVHGLAPADYDGPRLHAWLAAKPPSDANWPAFDIALSRSLMHFGEHLHRGRIQPAALAKLGIALQAKAPLDWPLLVEEWSKAADPAQALERLEPATAMYRALKAALGHYRSLAAQSPRLAPIASAKKGLRPGETRDSVPALRGLLQANGYLDQGQPAAADANLYDEALAEAVRHFQSQHGLEPDAVVGGQTLLQLNMTPANRVEQLRLGLERLRWLPERHDTTYLVVNVPSFRLYGFASGVPDMAKPDIAMNVIVGQAIDTRNTPVFQADMLYLVFRPYWNVPYNIARKELVPLIERDGGYLDKNEMEIVDSYGAGDGGALEASAENIDAVYGGRLRLRQRPGTKNALGPIKFVFPNMNSVYLHGTPQQRLFLRTRRDFSHGCIRVEDPAGLAEFVLKKQGGWDKERIESAMEGDKSFTLRLGGAIPVYIFYTTALADKQGQVLFYPDIYGEDAKLLKLL